MDLATLRRVPLFEALPEDAAQELVSAATHTTVPRSRSLFREGESGDQLYVMLSGAMKLVRHNPDGRENLVSVLGPGDMFGELSLFDPGPRFTTATAITDCALMAIAAPDVDAVLHARPETARVLLRALAHRLRKTNESLTDLVFSDVPGRVAKALLDLGQRFGRSVGDGVHVPHGLTQEELAQMVGASRETVNKALADFAARGWIRLDQRSVVLLDAERLRRRGR